MTFQERADRLRTHPDTVVIEVGGQDYPWFLGRVSFRLAKEKGIDLAAILGEFDGLDDDDGVAALAPMLDQVGRLVFAGACVFDEGLEEDDLADLLSIGDLPRLMPQMLDSLQAAAEADSAGNAAAATRKAQGAADRKRGRA